MPISNNDPGTELRERLRERFWSYVDRRGPEECWPWQRQRNKAGYGAFRAGARKVTAHRFAWLLIKGDIPADTYVCHRCDNPPCCNPAHLFLGSPAANMTDKKLKGRAPAGEEAGRTKLTDAAVRRMNADYRTGKFSHRQLAAKYGVAVTYAGLLVGGKARHGLDRPSGTYKRAYSRGTNNPRAKLTEDDVREIRRAHSAGEATAEDLRRRFGVTGTTIRLAITRKTWSHL